MSSTPTSNTSTQFKLLRCLTLCLLGFAIGPAPAMAQIVTLASMNLAEPLGRHLGEEDAELEALVQNDGLLAGEGSHVGSLNDRSLTKPKALTFQTLSPNLAAVNGMTQQPNSQVLTAQSNGDSWLANTKGKKAKKAKKAKKSKKYKKYCGLYFQSIVRKGSEFRVSGNFSSTTWIQIFDSETTFLSGASALQTIEYSTASQSTLSAGDQLGSLTLKSFQARELTFQYLASNRVNYNEVRLVKKEGYAAIVGRADRDNESYVVISDGRRGNKCSPSKKLKKSKRSTQLTSIATVTPATYPSATEFTVFNQELSVIQIQQYVQLTTVQRQSWQAYQKKWTTINSPIARFLGVWYFEDRYFYVYPSQVKSRVCVIVKEKDQISARLGTVLNRELRYGSSSFFWVDKGDVLANRNAGNEKLYPVFANYAPVLALNSEILQAMERAQCQTSLPYLR